MAASQPEARPLSEASGELAEILRATAARAAELVGGGIALLFAHEPDGQPYSGPPPLRAAAGFERADAARGAERALQDALLRVGEARDPAPLEAPEALGAVASGGLYGLPLGSGGRIHGALLVASSGGFEAAREGLARLAEGVGLRLDHRFLARRV